MRPTKWIALGALLAAGACSDGEKPGGTGPQGTAGTTGAAGTMGAAGASGAAGMSGAAGTSGGAGDSGVAGTGGGAAGSSGVAGTGGGAAGTGVAGTSGAAGASGAAGTGGGAAGTSGAAGGGTTPGLTDPGTEGDGDFTINAPYKLDAASSFVTGTPVGGQFAFKMTAAESTIYAATSATPARTQFNRNVWVYVPKQYVPGTPAPVIVVQDGNYACWWGNDTPHPVNTGGNLPGTANLPRILDNYIAQGKLPKMVAIFAEAGGGDGGNSQRGLEYDTVSGGYAEYVVKEMFPRVIAEAKKQLNIDLKLTDDPEGRAVLGGSSGGAGSYSMAWWHPDYFRRIITYSGTFVRQASPDNPLYPHGAWSYHDYDPYNEAMPSGLIMKEAAAKPLRHWLMVGSNDMGANGGPTTYRDFALANKRMALSYKMKGGYHYHFDFAMGAGHLDGGVVAQTLPAAMLWVWRGFPIK